MKPGKALLIIVVLFNGIISVLQNTFFTFFLIYQQIIQRGEHIPLPFSNLQFVLPIPSLVLICIGAFYYSRNRILAWKIWLVFTFLSIFQILVDILDYSAIEWPISIITAKISLIVLSLLLFKIYIWNPFIKAK